jgi:hypothetical protein
VIETNTTQKDWEDFWESKSSEHIFWTFDEFERTWKIMDKIEPLTPKTK